MAPTSPAEKLETLETTPEAAPQSPQINPHIDRPTELTLLAASEETLTPQQKAILIMREFIVDKNAFLAETKSQIEEIKEKSPSTAFKALDKLTEEYFGAKVSEFIATRLLPAVPEGHPAFSPEKTKTVNHTVFAGLDPKSPEYITWFKILAEILDLKNLVIAEYLEAPVAKEQMHPTARLEYLHFREISSAINDFFLVWSQDAASLMSPGEREKRGFKDELATIRLNQSGEYEEVPWNKAFPKEIERIISAYENLAAALKISVETAPAEDQELYLKKAEYFESVAKAFNASTLDAFKEADTLLPGQSLSRTDLPTHIHTIEIGYGADNIQRVPEASMRYPDEDGRIINENALETRKSMIRELEMFLSEGEYSEETWRTLEMVGATTYLATHFHGAGMEMDFVPAAQILPNEADCRIQGGVSVTANRDASIKRIPQFHDAFETMFGTEMGEKLFKRGTIDPDFTNGTFIASHEYGHAVGLTPTTADKLTKLLVFSYVEEWKSTVGGMVLAEWRTSQNPDIAENKITIETLRQSLTYHIATAGRYTRNRKQDSAVPYLRKSIMIVKVLEETGVLFETNGKWEIDLSEEKVTAAYTALEAQYKELIGIYDKGGKADLEAFLQTHLQVGKFAEHMNASIDTKFPEETHGAKSLKEICEIPGN